MNTTKSFWEKCVDFLGLRKGADYDYGHKVKVFAKIIMWIGIAVGTISLLFCVTAVIKILVQYSSMGYRGSSYSTVLRNAFKSMWQSIVIIVVSIVSVIPISAFGQLVEDTRKNRELLEKMEKDLENK